MRIRAAYETSKGNPFSAYNINDFQFSDDSFELVTQGCRVLSKEHNLLRVVLDQPEFSCKVSGFDVNRDIVVRAVIEKPDETTDQATDGATED